MSVPIGKPRKIADMRGKTTRADGRIAANAKRFPQLKRVPAEKGRAIRSLLSPDIAQRAADESTFVYFARVGNAIKIGYSKNVRSRMDTIQTSHSERIVVEYVVRGGKELESYLHRKFHQSRRHGEWFHYRGEIEAFLNGLPYDESEGAIIL